jgi:hypothetical protein
MSARIRIGQLRLAIPRSRAPGTGPSVQALAKSVAAQLAAALAGTPDGERRDRRSLSVQLPLARSSAADIARAIRKSLEEG